MGFCKYIYSKAGKFLIFSLSHAPVQCNAIHPGPYMVSQKTWFQNSIRKQCQIWSYFWWSSGKIINFVIVKQTACVPMGKCSGLKENAPRCLGWLLVILFCRETLKYNFFARFGLTFGLLTCWEQIFLYLYTGSQSRISGACLWQCLAFVPLMINFCLCVIEVQSLNSFLWQISTFKKEKREDSSLKYVVHVTCFEVFEIIWKLDYLMFLKYFEEKLNIFDILRNLVWTRLYWVRAGRVRWKLWAVRQNFLRKKPVRHKTGYYFFCLITTTTYFANFKKPSAPEVANHCNEHVAEDCRKMSGRKWLCLRQHQISFWLINLKMVNNCQSMLSIVRF